MSLEVVECCNARKDFYLKNYQVMLFFKGYLNLFVSCLFSYFVITASHSVALGFPRLYKSFTVN